MKYIIDVSDEVVGFMDGEMSFFVEPKRKDERRRHYVLRIDEEDVSIYTESDRKAIEDEVWKFVEKLEYLTVGETEDCFDVEYEGTPFVAGMFSYQEAKAKYDAWKKEKEEIRVGDEVKHRGRNYVVGYVGADKVYHLIDENWLRTVVQGGYQLIKTGRHFPEVAELLEKMRGKYD